MKKLFAFILAALLLISCVSCSGKKDGGADIIPDVDEASMGGMLWKAFADECEKNTDASTEEMASTVSAVVADVHLVVTPAEEGFLWGFDNFEIKGFEEAAVFMPMIGSIPFVGYIFRLPDGADVAAFVKDLTDNANPSWNICVTADQTVAGSLGNNVFFVMCPRSIG